MSSQLCIECHQKPKFSNGNTVHPYCGRTCAQAAKQSSGTPTKGDALCDHCHAFPKRVEGNVTHPYCSRTCADNALCLNCHNRLKFCEKATGKVHDYCGKTCANSARSGLGGGNRSTGRNVAAGGASPKNECLMQCGRAVFGKHHFCSKSCATKAEKKSPTIIEVPKGHSVFDSVVDQFETSWRSGTPCPTVERVYRVVISGNLVHKYKAYRTKVEGKGDFASKGESPGNERRRWHGTKRACTLGDNGQTSLCTSSGCSLCAIIRTSYKMKFMGSNTGWGRFGRGIYTSSASSKSDAYIKNLGASSTKVLILNKVVVGKGYKTTQDQPALTSPPVGYDSVLAEPGAGLNYDELVCYTDDAIRPAYLVIYT